MEKHNLEQGSLEWFEYRNKHNNASEAGVIMECAPKWMEVNSWRKLWEVRHGLRVTKPFAAMTHGNNLEAAALAKLNSLLGSNMEPAVFSDGDYSASLDGYGIDKEGQSIKAEIKCPWKGKSAHTWKDASVGVVSEHYRYQMIHQDMVCPTESSLFFVYIDDETFLLLPHLSSESDTKKLVKQWEKFNAKEPDPEWIERDDDKIVQLVTNHKRLLQDKTIIDVELKLAEKALKEEAGDNNVMAFGTKIQTIEKKGSVDYKTVPQLEGIDLEAFRRPGTTYQKITHEKESKNA
jgi:putative phage-type endonuclease